MSLIYCRDFQIHYLIESGKANILMFGDESQDVD